MEKSGICRELFCPLRAPYLFLIKKRRWQREKEKNKPTLNTQAFIQADTRREITENTIRSARGEDSYWLGKSLWLCSIMNLGRKPGKSRQFCGLALEEARPGLCCS